MTDLRNGRAFASKVSPCLLLALCFSASLGCREAIATDGAPGHDGGGGGGHGTGKDGTGKDGAPVPPKPEVRITPADRSSNVPQGAVSLAVDDPTNSINRDALERLAGLAHLLTWPDERLVDVDVTISTQMTSSGTLGRVQLKPKAALADGWYVIEVDPLGVTMRWPDFPGFVVASDGGATSHFRVGSEPQAISVWVCEKGGGSMELLINLSERVRLASNIHEQVKITGADRCRVVESGGSEVGQITLICPNFPSVGDVTLSLQSAFTSLSDADASVAGATAEYTFAVDQLSPGTTGCKVYRP